MSAPRDDGESGDGGYDEWIDAVATGEGYYLACPNGHGSLPPRRTCPHCGAVELGEEPLAETGTVETYTVIHVATPAFAAAAPYVSAIAEFDAVRLTGVLDVDPEDAAVGMGVEAGVGTNAEGDRILRLRPR